MNNLTTCMSAVVLYRLVYVNSHNLHTGEYLEDGDLEHVLKYIEVRGGHEGIEDLKYVFDLKKGL